MRLLQSYFKRRRWQTKSVVERHDGVIILSVPKEGWRVAPKRPRHIELKDVLINGGYLCTLELRRRVVPEDEIV